MSDWTSWLPTSWLGPSGLGPSVQLMLAVSIIGLVPSIFLLSTCWIRFVVVIGGDAGDLANEFRPMNHFAKDGVFVGQPGSRLFGNKKLASVGAGPGVGHGQQARTIKLQ